MIWTWECPACAEENQLTRSQLPSITGIVTCQACQAVIFAKYLVFTEEEEDCL